MCPTRAPGTSSSTASSMPSPARSTGTTTTSVPRRRPAEGPSGVSTVTSVAATSSSASAASSTLMRVAARRNSSGGVSLSRSVASASCTSGCWTMCSGTAQHYTSGAFALRPGAPGTDGSVTNEAAAGAGTVRSGRAVLGFRTQAGRAREPGSMGLESARMKTWAVLLVMLSIAAAAVLAQPARRSVALVVTGGTVVTQNASRQVLAPGAVAIDAAAIVEVGPPGAIAATYQARETIDARGQV